jgi:hypothetical protein
MLPEFYQTHLQNQLKRADYLILTILINLLQSIKQVNLEKLATAFPLPILFESRRRKLQRFLLLPNLRLEEGWFILTNLGSLETAIEAYKKRFGIEEMFRDLKTGGYNLEATNVKGQRLISLLILITLAYSSSTIVGENFKQIGIQQYIGRSKETGRKYKRHRDFYLGLFGETWTMFWSNCSQMVEDLMKLNRNKQQFYQRGLRAIKLIQSRL